MPKQNSHAIQGQLQSYRAVLVLYKIHILAMFRIPFLWIKTDPDPKSDTIIPIKYSYFLFLDLLEVQSIGYVVSAPSAILYQRSNAVYVKIAENCLKPPQIIQVQTH